MAGDESSLIGRILGAYRLEALLGRGGMGEVYRARDTRLGREVAIKILPRDRVDDPERKLRFLHEARAASALNHPNIVTLHDIVHDGGVDFLVLEYVRGKSLHDVIPPNGMPLADVLAYGTEIAQALAAAHAAGILHRDIKPANVMVTLDGHAKVLDFGLAKLMGHRATPTSITRTMEPALTEPGIVMGTVAYMSPEQARGEPVDARTDLFSLGAVLYEMVKGRRAFPRAFDWTPPVISRVPTSCGGLCSSWSSQQRTCATSPRERWSPISSASRKICSPMTHHGASISPPRRSWAFYGRPGAADSHGERRWSLPLAWSRGWGPTRSIAHRRPFNRSSAPARRRQ